MVQKKIIPPRKQMVINGKIRGAGYEYHVKTEQPKIAPKENKDEL